MLIMNLPEPDASLQAHPIAPSAEEITSRILRLRILSAMIQRSFHLNDSSRRKEKGLLKLIECFETRTDVLREEVRASGLGEYWSMIDTLHRQIPVFRAEVESRNATA
jgi:hypothetical protein